MGLIDLKTDLKSLKYSKDRIGGGSSTQPFVQKPIPDSFSAVGNTGGLDVLTRGGSLVFQKTADDVSRLSKLLLTANTFQGPAFTIKQNVLSRQNVRTQASPKALNQGPYLPTSTIAQAAISATGLHFNTFGVNPIPGLPGSLTTYSDVVPYDQPSANNRLVKLTDSFVSTKTLGNTLYSYSGGPGSLLGLGKTKIQIPIEQRTGRNGINYNAAEDRIKLYPTTYTKTLPAVGEFDDLGNIDIEANQFGNPALLNTTNTTEVTVNGPESIRQTNNYANLNYLVPTSTLAGITIDPAKSYQANMPGTTRNIKVIDKKDTELNPSLGTILNVNQNADSTFAKENFPNTTLYKLGGITNSGSLLGASTSANLIAEFPGVSTTTNNLVTLDTLRVANGLGTKSNIQLNANSKYAEANNLTGSLFGFGSEYDSSRSVTPLLVETPSQTTADSGAQVLENTQAFTFDQDQLRTQVSYRESGQIQDFRKKLRNTDNFNAKAVGAKVLADLYSKQNIELRVHAGDPGKKGDVSNFVRGKADELGSRLGPVDKITALPLYQSSNVAQDKDQDVNDLVKFRIAVKSPDGGATKTFIHFRAFLDSISDSYTSDWSSHRYVGRGENFYTYGGFDRKVSLSWTVYAQSKEELIPMYKKLNYLASSLAPDYSTDSYMRGVLVELTIGGYLYNQPGIITGFTYELSEQSTWEIGINNQGFTDVTNRGDDSMKELPHMIKVTGFNFTPIHTFIPQVQKTTAGEFIAGADLGNGPQRYIALNSGYDNNYDSVGTYKNDRGNNTNPSQTWGTDADWVNYETERVRTNVPITP